MEKRHAILSPSAANRWLRCTPSARFEEQIPETVSVYAAEGTLAHEVAAIMLAQRAGVCKSEAVVKSQLKKCEAHDLYTPDMIRHAEEYALYVTDRLTRKAQVRIEQALDLSPCIPLSFGTSDAIIWGDNDLHVFDYKYGAGKRISAHFNEQLMVYALGALTLIGEASQSIESIHLHIHQPRAGGESEFVLTPTELYTWQRDELTPKANLAIAGQGEFIAGSHCGFCKARFSCAAYYSDYERLERLRDKRTLTPAQVREVLTKGGEVAKWLKAFEENAVAELLEGKTIEGFKLVSGRGKRAFKSEYDVVEVLISEGFDSLQIYDSKLVSLTSLEKQLGKKRFNSLFEKYIIQLEGSPKIVPNDDARGEISSADDYD